MAATSTALSSASILTQSPFSSSSSKKSFKIVAMAAKTKVNRYDSSWSKKWFGAGLFSEASEEVNVDLIKKLEKRKVLSSVEKAGLLSKAESFGLTLSSIEKLGLLSKLEELGLLSLVENASSISPSALASLSLPLSLASLLALVLIPDDSLGLVVVQSLIGGVFAIGAAGLFAGSIVLDGLQESE